MNKAEFLLKKKQERLQRFGKIRSEFNGRNTDELARKYNVTHGRMKNILAQALKDERNGYKYVKE